MRFAVAVLISMVATAASASSGSDKPGLDPYGGEITEVLVQRYNSPRDMRVPSYARASEEQPLNIHFPTQTQNQTPEAVPNKHVHTQKRTDSSTPGTQIMSPWRQVVGGIAVAVLVAVV